MEKTPFLNWLDSGLGPFWIYGIPGAYFIYVITDDCP
jgi:hypothetical protein